MNDLLTGLLLHIETLCSAIDSGKIDGERLGLFTFTESRETIEDIVCDIKEAISTLRFD